MTSWRQLYVDDATAHPAQVRPRQRLRPARSGDLGARLRRDAARAVERDPGEVHHRHRPRRRSASGRSPPTSRNPGFTVTLDRHRRRRGSPATTSRSRSTAAPWRAWLTGTKADVGRLVRRRRPRLRLPRPGPRRRRATRAPWNVASHVAATPAALAVGGFGVGPGRRPRGPCRARHLGAASSAASAAGDLVAIVARPAERRRLHLVPGRRAARRVVRGPAAAPRLGRGPDRQRRPASRRRRPPNATRVAAALGGLGFGNAGPASIGATPAAVGQRAVLAQRRRLGATRSRDRLDQRPDASTASSCASSAPNGTLVGERPGRASSRARPRGHDLERDRRRPTAARTAATSSRSSARAGGTTLYNPVRSFRAAALAALRRDDRHRRPDRPIGVDQRAACCRRTATASATSRPGLPRRRRARPAGRSASRRSAGSDVGTPVADPVRGAAAARPSPGTAGPARRRGRRRRDLSPASSMAADAAGNRVSRIVDRPRRPDAAADRDRSRAGRPSRRTATASRTPPGWPGPPPSRITGTARILHGTTRRPVVDDRRPPRPARCRGPGRDAAGAARRRTATYTFRVTGRDAAGNAADRGRSRSASTGRSARPLDAGPPSTRGRRRARGDGPAVVPPEPGRRRQRGDLLGDDARPDRSGPIGPSPRAPTRWTWNGRNDAGAFARRGTYTLRVTARSGLGTTVLTRDVLVDALRGRACPRRRVRAGQTLTVTLITTEPPSGAPTVTFSQPGRAAVRRTATALGGGRYRVAFVVARGSAGTATITISGRDTRGGTNTTSRHGRGRDDRALHWPDDDRRRARRADPPPTPRTPIAGRAGGGVWVVLPTYNEAENLRPIGAAILAALPGATLLVVDDGSPDGTGTHRRRPGRGRRPGPGPPSAGEAGPRPGLSRRVRRRPRRRRRRRRPDGRRLVARPGRAAGPVAPIVDGDGRPRDRLALRPGGGVVDWGLGRRVISRGGSLFARIVLGLEPHDLTGGFKAWRAATLARSRSPASTPAATSSRSR